MLKVYFLNILTKQCLKKKKKTLTPKAQQVNINFKYIFMHSNSGIKEFIQMVEFYLFHGSFGHFLN